MLVLSRHLNQEVVFPTLGITIQVLRIAGNTVRLGIEAPESVPVHRREVSRKIERSSSGGASEESVKGLTHTQRNHLNSVVLSLTLLQKQLEAGMEVDITSKLSTVLSQLEEVENATAKGRQLNIPARLKRRALLVDDAVNERELLASYLRMSGLDVETAEDGEAAIKSLLSKPRFDVVLLDMVMPHCDGPSTIAKIRHERSWDSMKVFAVSGREPEQCGVSIGNGGADRWFLKPLNPMKLVQAIEGDLRI